jgi:hypothetical protein
LRELRGGSIALVSHGEIDGSTGNKEIVGGFKYDEEEFTVVKLCINNFHKT